MKLFPSIFLSLLLPLAVMAQSVQIQDGAILAEFSVSDSTKVYFSQGNLQYQASICDLDLINNNDLDILIISTFRFAEHQWDFVGDSVLGNVYEDGIKSDNANISPVYNGWIDLFGWGTSGYNYIKPYEISTHYGHYGASYADIAGTNYDWGVNNKISNGGNQVGLWRTLTHKEWEYVVSKRLNARYLQGMAIVNGVKGLILLPDNWEPPKGVTFTNEIAIINNRIDVCPQNIYSTIDWNKMEANGAVFLPAAGYRDGTDVSNVGFGGFYWSSSNCHHYEAGFLHVYYDARARIISRSHGLSVRLVQDVKK